MNYYSIKELENYSGIKAHTIRMWEKRYSLLDPTRTDTNIRLYDDDQLLKLLNTVTLLESGWKISKVSKLSKTELKETTTKCFEGLADDNFQVPINALITATFDFDEIEFEKIINSCNQKIGVYKTITLIVYPFLHRIGMMWRLSEISPAQEHFASNLIRQKLIASIDKLPSVKNKPTGGVALFLANDEYHELGLLLAQYILKKKEIKSYYLGSNLPIQSLEIMVNKCKPEVLLTFLITRKPHEQIIEYISELSDTFKHQKIWIAAHRSVPQLIKNPPHNCQFMHSIAEFEKSLP